MRMPGLTINRRDLVLGTALIGLAGSPTRLAAQAPTRPEAHVLRAQMSPVRLAGGDRPATSLAAFDGAVPGPTIRAKRAEEVRVRLVNELNEPMGLHWHGIRLANAMDGVPHLTQRPVGPGESFDYAFTCPDAGTFWYRAALPGPTTRGLSGLLVVEDNALSMADREVTLFVDAWWLSPSQPHVRVNGAAGLDIPVRTHERLRLRVVNASGLPNAVTFERHRIVVIALDGQPAEPLPARDSRLLLGPGNRADIVLDAALAPGASTPITVQTDAGTHTLARLVYATDGPARAAPLADPPPLPANPLPDRMALAAALRHELAIEAIEGKAGPWSWRPESAAAPGRPLFSARRGRVVMLALHNRTDLAATVHLHGHSFRLLDRLDDGWKPFWLDTLLLPSRSTARIAFVADNPGRWLIEAQGIAPRPDWRAAWFEVT